MRFTLIRFVMAAIWIICAYKWSDYKNWKKYYPTMMFFGFGDLIYTTVFKDKKLWAFECDFLVCSINELFVIFTIFFSTTLLFLSRFPKGIWKQIKYIVFWIALYLTIEIFTTSIGMQKNSHGWNLWWSLFHNSVQFPLLILHHKNPVLAWIIAFIFLGLIMKNFGVPAILGR